MHPNIFVIPLITLILGLGFGMILALVIKRPSSRSAIKWITFSFFIASWWGYLAGVLYWRFKVEPTLDGTEGSGVGFGKIFIHLFAILPAVFSSGLVASLVSLRSKHEGKVINTNSKT